MDKVYHFLAGLLITYLTYLVARMLHLDARTCFVLSLCICAAFAACKELYDKYVKETFFDILDFVATMLGGIVLLLGVYALLYLLQI